MRSLNGIPNNFDNLIIGRVSTKQIKGKKRRETIFTTPELNYDLKDYKAIISSKKLSSDNLEHFSKIPLIHSVANLDYLNDGDLVLLEMDKGVITVMIENNSVHNSIFATSQCNCRCIMCPQPSEQDPSDREQINLEIIRLMDSSTGALGITGGEPTINKERLINILRQCKKYLLKTQIQILTNGILLKSIEYVKEIANIGIPNLFYCIPLYADTDIEHDYIMQKENAYRDTILGLYNLAALKQSVEIRIVVFSYNYKRLSRIAEFIYHNFPFVKHVAIMGMELEGIAKKNIKKLWISPQDYMPLVEKAVFYLSRRDIDVSIYNEQLCLMPKKLWAFSCKSISDWKNIHIEECDHCTLRAQCGGFFKSVSEDRMKLIKAIRNS